MPKSMFADNVLTTYSVNRYYARCAADGQSNCFCQVDRLVRLDETRFT